MIVNVAVTEYWHQITPHEVGLARDTHTASVLRANYSPAWFSTPKHWNWPADFSSGRGFQWYVNKYAEVTTDNPWNDVLLYFANLAKVKGSPTPTGLLYYPGRYPILNSAAMAAAAEALVGWFCQMHYNWDLVIRPPRVTPDLVFRDRTSKRWGLVEVKSSGRLGDVRNKLTTDMIKLLRVLSSTKQLRPKPYYAALVMVQVAGPTDAWLTSLILEEV